MHHTIDLRRDGEDKAHDGSRGANVKQRTIGAHRRTNQNERAKRAGEVREGNEKRIAGMEVMVAASKKMSQFMSQQNPEQRRRKRKTGQKSGRIFIKEREGPQQLIDGHDLNVRVRHGKLRACDKE